MTAFQLQFPAFGSVEAMVDLKNPGWNSDIKIEPRQAGALAGNTAYAYDFGDQWERFHLTFPLLPEGDTDTVINMRGYLGLISLILDKDKVNGMMETFRLADENAVEYTVRIDQKAWRGWNFTRLAGGTLFKGTLPLVRHIN